MMVGTPAMTKTLPMRKPGAVETLLRMSSPPAGIRAIRMRAWLSSAPPKRARSSATASGWWSIDTPNALATASAVMSS